MSIEIAGFSQWADNSIVTDEHSTREFYTSQIPDIRFLSPELCPDLDSPNPTCGISINGDWKLKRILSMVAYVALYIVVGVIMFMLWAIVASAIIVDGTNNELGRMGEGIFATYLGFVLSFFVFSPIALLIFHRQNTKRKRKLT